MENLGSSRFDRTDPEYLYSLLDQAFAVDSNAVVCAARAEKPPQNFMELVEVVEAKRNADCAVSDEVDKVMEIIAALPERDEIARQLPYTTEDGFLHFVVPKIDGS